MRFSLTSCKSSYDEDEVKKMKVLGFKFKEEENVRGLFWKEDYCPIIEIDNIEDLIEFIEKWGAVVIGKATKYLNQFEKYVIEIYDDYRE
jgi:hypothetical protein